MQMSLYDLLDDILSYIEHPHAPPPIMLFMVGIALLVAVVAAYIIWTARSHQKDRTGAYHPQRRTIKRPH